MIIGTFVKRNDGFIGKLITLTHSQALTIEPATKGADYRVLIGAIEVGAVWKRFSKESGKAYLSVKLDSPFLPVPVNCALMAQDDGSHILVWNRDDRKQD